MSTSKDNAPGPIYFANVNKQNFHASFRRHYLDFFALIPLKNFSLSDGLTTRWLVDIYVTRARNLERICKENFCQLREITQDHT